ncbi:MAG: LytTR family DNA-binding domain-containing protein [Butyrivibrio sp.]|nr:LytTR family DNA-binding domain-containing protein [Butyrivibrio sp.]
MSVSIALCDDDYEQIKHLRNMIDEWSSQKPFAVSTACYENAEQFLFEYEEKPCGLLLLDIEMSGINGMELAKKLRANGDMLPIIFVTGYSEYMEQGYDVEALHYLIKPIEKDKLFAVLDKYSQKREHSDQILLTTANGIMHISTDDITYIEAFGRNSAVHTLDGNTFDCNMGISKFEKTQGFIRPHRSYIVNLRFVRSIEKNALTLDDGSKIPISRRLYNNVNKLFIEFYTME